MRWLRSKFRKVARWFKYRSKPKPPPADSLENRTEGEIIRRNEGKHRRYKRVALVRGHTDSSSGCSSYPVAMPVDFGGSNYNDRRKRREYDITAYVFRKVKEVIDLASFSMSVKEFLRDGVGVKGVGRQLEKWQPDLVLAGHKNSVGSNSDVEGREILMQKKYKGTIAESEARRMLRLLEYFIGPSPLRGDKGIRWTTRKMRGDYNLDVYDDCGCKVVMLLEEEFIGKRTPTAVQLMEGNGLKNNADAIAHFCLGYDIIEGKLIAP